MEILDKLKDQGWYLTEDGLKKLPDNNDLKKIISAALDFDFREIAGGALPPELSKKDESFPGNIVLQVQRIRNISAPKANEDSKAAPRFLQIELSDGVTLMQALELEHISVLSMNTPPGTKIHFKCKQIPLMQGMIVMKPVDIQVLGGKVAALVEKWEMTRSLQKYAKSGRQHTGTGSGPPPWIAFGQKMQQPVNNDKNFKSLAQVEKEKESGKENDEFNAMRSEAIAEAAKVGGKKIFGGGNHQILDHNVKKILEKGFTEEEAKNALRQTGNSLERALYNLKRRSDDFKNREDFRDKFKSAPMGGNKRGSKEIGSKRGKEVEVAGTAKPAANVSLFDFLTDKLPSNAEQTPTLSQSSTTTTTTTAAPPFASHSNSSHQSYSSRPMTKAGSEPSSSTTTKPYYNSSSNSNTSYHDRKQQQQQQHQNHHQQQPQIHQNHDSSSSVKSQEQNNHTSNSNRPKFENNLSSSFATRNSSHPNEERYNRYSNSSRGGRGGSVGGNTGGTGGSGNPFHGRPNQPFEESSERHRDQKTSSGYSSGRGGGRGSQHNNNNYSGGRGGSSSGGYDNRRYNDYHNQKDQQNQHRHENRQDQQPQRNGYEQKTAANGKEATTSRYQQQKENSTNYQHNSGNNRQSYDNNRQQSGYNASSNQNNNNNNTSHNATHNTNSSSNNNSNNNEHTARVNKLVESTSKMKIEKTRSGPSSSRSHNQQQQQQPQQQQQQHHQRHHQQQQNYAQQQHQQQQQQQQQQSKQQQQQYQQPPPMNSTTTQKLQQTFGPLPNGFNYDPSKIIGFQAKETNEFALTLLKSQGVPTGPPSQVGVVPPSVAAQQPQFLSGPPPSAMHMAPQPFTTTTYVVPQGVAPPTHSPSAFGMIPGENWNWKIGDRCLAKYWDDGRYYEAEITGISDKTCVVLFLGYGNHEEVLKTDCLPITDAQNRTINFSNNNMQHVPPVSVAPQQQQHQQQQQQQQSSMLSRGVPNRYRGERQVYVPPPKRDN
ncbi:tudor domain-containing protein 3 [Episyrphus balteatus]|uniref:tudor domain-containing protein 3 n=1 Tax=Episyrphus balteatus TaxID=286459 RepID=UPI0024856463|nr:tudor domain-containing protein 3 [Episyrphus balteatus]